MPKTTYTKEEYIVKDINGNYLKHADKTEFITDYDNARKFKTQSSAQLVADCINTQWEMDHIVDVWGQPKRARVFKMTTSVVIEETK